MVALGLLAACGGSSPSGPSSTPTPAPTPTPAARSVLTLGARNNTFTVTSTTTVGRLLLKCGNFHADWTITESAGLEARLTKADFYLLELDGDIDGRMVTTPTTNNTVPARGTYEFFTDRTGCGYADRDFPAIMKGTVDLTDGRGNTQTLTAEIGFVER